MKKTIYNTLIFSVWLVLSLITSDCLFAQKAYEQPQYLYSVKARLANAEFNIMLARTQYEKAKGLMFHQEIASDTGMLFVYDYSHIMSFWMKNTRIPLDLVFFSEDLKVTEYIKNMIPGYGKPERNLPHYTSKEPAMYALELKAGTIDNLGIKIGDTLAIPLTLLYSKE